MGWSDWTPCSKTCGYGTQRRSYVTLTAAQNGGRPCPPAGYVADEVQLCGSMSNCDWSHFSFENWGQLPEVDDK